MLPHGEHKEREKVNYDFFLSIPELDRTKVQRFDVNRMKGVLDRLAGHSLALHTDDAPARSREDTEEDDAQ